MSKDFTKANFDQVVVTLSKDFNRPNFDQVAVTLIEKLLDEDEEHKKTQGMKKISSTDSNLSEDGKVPYIIYKDFATVYFLTHNDKKYVIKKFDELHHEHYMNEVNFLSYLKESDMVPTFYYHSEEKMYIVTEQYDGNVLALFLDENILEETINVIVETINKMLIVLNIEYGVKHNDIKYNNVVYKKNNDFYKFAFIDFSLSSIVTVFNGEEIKKAKLFRNMFDCNYVEFMEYINKQQFYNWLGSPFTRFQQLRAIETNETDDIKTLSFSYKLAMYERNKINLTLQ